MGELDDKVFIKRFSGIIAGLVIVTILIIIIAVGNDQLEPGLNPSHAIMAEQRVAPAGAVRTELPSADNVVTADAGSSEESTTVDTDELVSATPTDSSANIDGSGIYASTCIACHSTGVAQAPIPGSDIWNERAAKGVDALVANAIAGIAPMMPAKGGNPNLTDEEIRAVVEHMMTL
ncbi:MAG: cytochrome c5 [Lysobacterales bacterium]|jgi:cytochrome c5